MSAGESTWRRAIPFPPGGKGGTNCNLAIICSQLKRRTAALRREAIPGDGQETDVSEDEEGQEAVDSEDEDAQNADPAGLQGPQNPARPPAPEPLHGV